MTDRLRRLDRPIDDPPPLPPPPPSCGHDPGIHSDYKSVADMRAEIARLRRIEEAARLLADNPEDTQPFEDRWDALRAALEEKP